MKILYCEICDVRLTPESFEMGDAVTIEGTAYCSECARQLQGRAPGETVILSTESLNSPPRPGPASSAGLNAVTGGVARGMRKARLSCPSCATRIVAEVPKAGGQVTCGVCGTTLSVKPKRERTARRIRRRLR